MSKAHQSSNYMWLLGQEHDQQIDQVYRLIIKMQENVHRPSWYKKVEKILPLQTDINVLQEQLKFYPDQARASGMVSYLDKVKMASSPIITGIKRKKPTKDALNNYKDHVDEVEKLVINLASFAAATRNPVNSVKRD